MRPAMPPMNPPAAAWISTIEASILVMTILRAKSAITPDAVTSRNSEASEKPPCGSGSGAARSSMNERPSGSGAISMGAGWSGTGSEAVIKKVSVGAVPQPLVGNVVDIFGQEPHRAVAKGELGAGGMLAFEAAHDQRRSGAAGHRGWLVFMLQVEIVAAWELPNRRGCAGRRLSCERRGGGRRRKAARTVSREHDTEIDESRQRPAGRRSAVDRRARVSQRRARARNPTQL